MTLSPCSISVERSNQPTNQTEEETDRGSVQRVPRVLCSRRRPRSVRGRRPGPAPGMAWCPRRRGLRVPLFSGRFPRRISGRSRELANQPQAYRPGACAPASGRASHPLPRPSAATLSRAPRPAEPAPVLLLPPLVARATILLVTSTGASRALFEGSSRQASWAGRTPISMVLKKG